MITPSATTPSAHTAIAPTSEPPTSEAIASSAMSTDYVAYIGIDWADRKHDNLVLVPINPKTVANYRKAFQPSRAKSDPVDARLLVELMRGIRLSREILVGYESRIQKTESRMGLNPGS